MKYPLVEIKQEDIFMLGRCEWFLSDGSLLIGKDAEEYLLIQLKHYETMIKRIDSSLDSIHELNQLVERDYLVATIMETGESLSWILLELESLLKELSLVLESPC